VQLARRLVRGRGARQPAGSGGGSSPRRGCAHGAEAHYNYYCVVGESSERRGLLSARLAGIGADDQSDGESRRESRRSRHQHGGQLGLARPTRASGPLRSYLARSHCAAFKLCGALWAVRCVTILSVRSSLSTGLVGQTPKSPNPALARPDLAGFHLGASVRRSACVAEPPAAAGRERQSAQRPASCPGQQPPRFKHDRPGCPSRRTVTAAPRHWQAAAAVTGSALTQSVGISGSASTTVSCTRRPLRLRLGNLNLT
jgi:hypothetical protein